MDIASYHARLRRTLWQTDLSQSSLPRRLAFELGRFVDGVYQAFESGELSLRLMGLAYTTLLSLVPLLAVGFSVLKAFGVQQQLEPLLAEFLAPLGAQGQLIHERILSFVNHLQVGVLGIVGFAMLFYTAVSLLTHVERAFNIIWRVRNGRSTARRFSDYLTIILVGPVLVFTAIGLANNALSSRLLQALFAIDPLGISAQLVRQLGSYLLIAGAFAFFYGFLPNTRVPLRPALAGGLFAGALWLTVGKLFAVFIATSSSYSALYSGFAGAVLFVVWVYTNWMILIIGAQLTAYLQNPRLLEPKVETAAVDDRWREQVALECMVRIAGAYRNNQPYWTLAALQSRYPGFQSDAVATVVERLEQRRLIVADRSDPPAYLPARESEAIRLIEVVAAVRETANQDAMLPTVATILDELDAAVTRTLGGRTLKDLMMATQDNNF
ncbi:MAG: YihY/virulence factor BrkB family protein [Candidatus Competibacteraceae bacterium]